MFGERGANVGALRQEGNVYRERGANVGALRQEGHVILGVDPHG